MAMVSGNYSRHLEISGWSIAKKDTKSSADRTNHHQGAWYCDALAGAEPLRVGAAGHDQRG